MEALNGAKTAWSAEHALQTFLDQYKMTVVVLPFIGPPTYSWDNLTDDDVTVLVVRPTGAGTKVPIINRLKAPWLFIGACIRAILTGKRPPLPEFTWANFGGSLFDGLSRVGRKGASTKKQL